MKTIWYFLVFLLLIGTVYGASSAYGADGLTVTGLNLTGGAGQSITGAVTLANTGNTTLNLTLAASVGGGIYASFNPSTINSMAPGTSQSTVATFTIPASAVAGTYVGLSVVAYTGASTGSVSAPININVTSSVPSSSFTITNLDLGSTSQQRGQTITSSVTLSNNGNQPLTISLTSTLPSQYQVVFSQPTVTVNPGASINVPVTIMVPLSQDSGRNLVSGNIVATATNVQGLTQVAYVYITAQNNLNIYKVTIETNTDGQEHSIGSGNTYNRDIKPGTSITLRVYVRNTYNSLQDVSMNNVDVNVQSSSDLGVDESDTLNDLGYGQNDYISINSQIPSDASNGDNYYLTITATATDNNGATHQDTYNAQIQVRRPNEEISFQSATVTPQSAMCGQQVTITAQLSNTGNNRESDTEMSIVNSALGLNQRLYGMDLYPGDNANQVYAFTVGKDVAPGSYDILLWSYYRGSIQSDFKDLSFTVLQCNTGNTGSSGNTGGSSSSGNTGGSGSSGNTGGSGSSGTGTQGGSSVPPVVVPSQVQGTVYGSSSFTDSPTYVILLGAAVVVILLVLVMLLVKFVF